MRRAPIGKLGTHLAVRVDDDELVAKVAEGVAKYAKRLGHDEPHARAAAGFVDRDGLAQRHSAADDDDGVLADDVRS